MFSVLKQWMMTGNVCEQITLNKNDKFPHISIYQARFPKRNLASIQDAVRKLSSTVQPITLRLNDVTIDYDTFIWWNADKTPELLSLQREVIERINPMREGMLAPTLATLTNVPLEEQESIRMYGYANVGASRYRPHITITRAKRPQDATEMLKALGKRSATFRTTGIIVGYLGDHGIVSGIVEEFPILK